MKFELVVLSMVLISLSPVKTKQEIVVTNTLAIARHEMVVVPKRILMGINHGNDAKVWAVKKRRARS